MSMQIGIREKKNEFKDCGNNVFLVTKKLLVRRKHLPTLQLYLVHSLQCFLCWSLTGLFIPGTDQALSLFRTFTQPIPSFGPFLYSRLLPHLIFWVFVYMSLIPYLKKSHVLFSSSFSQSRAWDKDLCECLGSNMRMNYWAEHSCGHLAAWSCRTFWEAYKMHFEPFGHLSIGSRRAFDWKRFVCQLSAIWGVKAPKQHPIFNIVQPWKQRRLLITGMAHCFGPLSHRHN